MTQLPLYLSGLFVVITLAAVYLFFWASGGNKKLLLIAAAWMAITAVLAARNVLYNPGALPPPFLLVVLPPLLVTLILFNTTGGKKWLDGFDLGRLTLLHTVRIPVEAGIFLLFLHKLMPGLMTFEGTNFDLFSGLTAPVIYHLAVRKKMLGPKTLLGWNVLCLLILAATVTQGMLSAPTPLQQLAFDQPNVAVLFFPFVWLPAVVVPIVYLSHLVALRQLLLRRHAPATAGGPQLVG